MCSKFIDIVMAPNAEVQASLESEKQVSKFDANLATFLQGALAQHLNKSATCAKIAPNMIQLRTPAMLATLCMSPTHKIALLLTDPARENLLIGGREMEPDHPAYLSAASLFMVC